jgi:hypothetical protein
MPTSFGQLTLDVPWLALAFGVVRSPQWYRLPPETALEDIVPA